ncbi:unnamed protein product, partial [Rotaria sp. Silwood2]
MITYYCVAFLFLINVVFTLGETFPEETTGVELPPGHVQFYRVYASGYQNYICAMDSTGTWHWLLDHPVAVLRRYNAPDLNPEIDPIVGNHQHTLTKNFTINTAIWILAKARGLPIDTKTLAEAIDNVEDTYSLYA